MSFIYHIHAIAFLDDFGSVKHWDGLFRMPSHPSMSNAALDETRAILKEKMGVENVTISSLSFLHESQEEE